MSWQICGMPLNASPWWGVSIGTTARCTHHTPSQHSLNTPSQHSLNTLSIHLLNTPSQHTFSPPSQHNLSASPLNTPSQRTLSMHLLPLSQHTLSKQHLTPSHHTFSTHPLTFSLCFYFDSGFAELMFQSLCAMSPTSKRGKCPPATDLRAMPRQPVTPPTGTTVSYTLTTHPINTPSHIPYLQVVS